MRILVLGLVALFIGGCQSQLNAPTLAAGYVAVADSGNLVQTRALNEVEIAQVYSWLRANDNGWNNFTATPSGKVTAKLTATNGTPFGLYILDGLVVVNFSDSQYSRSFGDEEIRQLKLALGVRS
jgi:hypothetical protein